MHADRRHLTPPRGPCAGRGGESVDAGPGPDRPRHVPTLQVSDSGDLPDHAVDVEAVAHLRGAPKRDRGNASVVAVIEDDGNHGLPRSVF
jgi:hypothetical protein